jgi:hypothetical protein
MLATMLAWVLAHKELLSVLAATTLAYLLLFGGRARADAGGRAEPAAAAPRSAALGLRLKALGCAEDISKVGSQAQLL